MTNEKPFFSIIMPTRNRANLLTFAIESVLMQGFDDFEIVISDNFSQDNTNEIVNSRRDNRIRYFRHEKSLSLAENWGFGLDRSEGKYVIFLPDDDALTKDLLEKAKAVIDETRADLVNWGYVYYYLNDWKNEAYPKGSPLRAIRKGSFTFAPFDERLYEINPIEAIERNLNHVNGWLPIPNPISRLGRPPQLTNAVYSRILIEEITSRNLSFFRGFASDIYSGIIAMGLAKKHIFLDAPLSINCVSEISLTSQLNKKGKESMREYFSESKDEKPLKLVPMKAGISRNYWMEAVLQARASLGAEFKGLDVNWENYYLSCFDDLTSLQRNGSDIAEELEQFSIAISKETADLQDKLRTVLKQRASRSWISNEISRISPFGLRVLVKYRKNAIWSRQIVSSDDNLVFDNIKDCGEWFGSENIRRISKYLIERNGPPPFKWKIA